MCPIHSLLSLTCLHPVVKRVRCVSSPSESFPVSLLSFCAGYLSLPPCLWGDEEGLHPSVLLPPNTELVSVKKNWNTHMGHYGPRKL